MDFARVHLRCCPSDSSSCCDDEFFESQGIRCNIRQYKQTCKQFLTQSIRENAGIILFIFAETFLIQVIVIFESWFLVKSFSERTLSEERFHELLS